MFAHFVGGKLNGKRMTVEEVKEKHWNGKLTEDLTAVRNAGGWCHRKELDNLPCVDNYLTPMWDNGKIRYETQDVYDMLSR